MSAPVACRNGGFRVPPASWLAVGVGHLAGPLSAGVPPSRGASARRASQGRPGLRRPHFLSKRKWGERKGGGGISISLPHTPSLKRPIRGELRLPPIGCTPRSCFTGSLPAAKAYFVTPPPLGAGAHCAPLRVATITTPVFRRYGTDGGPAGALVTAQQPAGLAG